MANIGDVLNIQHLIACIPQISNDDIEGDVALGMTDMRVPVDRWTTDVNPHTTFLKRFEFFLPTCKGIMYLK
jgi:hypothetical protein